MDEYGNIIGGREADEVFGDSVHELEGFVEHIIYRNEDNGYTVFNIIFKNREVTCIGTFAALNEGEYISASGSYVKHPIYWKQFKINSYLLRFRKMKRRCSGILVRVRSRESVRKPHRILLIILGPTLSG